MKVVIKKIHVKNFFSVGNKWISIDFRKGLYRVSSQNFDCGGSGNGGGKSSLFVEGLMFGLYGKPVRKINLPDIPNTINGGKNCEVKLEFSLETKNYMIHRGINPSFLKLFENYQDGDENVRNNENEKQDSAKKFTQKRIDELIGASFNTMSHLLVMSNSYTSSFLDLEAAKKREVIEDILGISIFGNMAEIAKKEDLDMKGVYNVTKKEYELQNSNFIDFEENRKKLMEKSEKFDNDKKEALEKIKEKLKKINAETTLLKEKLCNESELSQKKVALSNEKVSISEILNKLDVDLQVAEKTLRSVTSDYKKLKDSPVCILCGTETSSEHVAQHIKELHDKINELTSFCEDKEKEKEFNQGKLRDVNSQIQQVDKDITLHVASSTKIQRLNEEKESIKLQVEEIKNKKNDFTELIDEKEYIKRKEELATTESKLEQVSKDKMYLEYIRKLLSEDGVKNYIIKKILRFWNSKVNFYLNELNAECSIYFDDLLNATIKSRNRDPLQYHSFSGGEKARIDVAILLSVLDISKLQNSMDLNVIVVDELLDGGLDDTGREDVLNLFKQMSIKQNKSIYVISHSSNLPIHLFDKEITLYKRNGFTYL